MKTKRQLLIMLFRKIRIFRGNDGLCACISHLNYKGFITDEEYFFLKFNVVFPNRPNKGNWYYEYWWPLTIHGNIQRCIFVLKLIIKYWKQ